MPASVRSAPWVRWRKTAALLVLTALGLSIPAVHGQNRSVLERRVPGPVESILVDNPRGDTEVQSWSGRDVRVLAERPDAAAGSSLASDLTIERTVPKSLR